MTTTGTDSTQPPAQPDSQADFPIVGIGASAGGVQALQALFEALPADLGAAYVVIVHLDPGYQSELAAILQARTRMSVVEVRGTVQLKPNHVYVIPPNQKLLIADSEIGTAEFDEPRGRRTPIDQFFRSLAEQRGDGIAVVLTGAGSDGSAGVKAIKEAGGLIIVQDPAEAEHGSMPRSAIATGAADLVLPVSGIAAQLAQIIPVKRRIGAQPLAKPDEGVLQRIFTHIKARTGHDFANYKRSTMLRRIARRMQVNRIETLEDYASRLAENAEEVQALFADLLISVTSFFRDRAAFEALATGVLPHLFENRDTSDSIRAWVPGCATGEEAYSIAILLLEEASRHDQRPEIQVFASDIDSAALVIARDARYPRAVVTDVPEEYLRKYFIEEDDHFRIKKEVREIVLFAVHNVLKDPPFSRLDLISCRNLLIYLGRQVHQQAIATFHYALKPGGYLFLGASEGADAPAGLFHLLDPAARIHQALGVQAGVRRSVPKLSFSPRLPSGPAGRMHPGPTPSDAVLHQVVLESAAPPSILVDNHFRVIHLSESAGRYLQHPGGPLQNDITEIVRPELRLSLWALLNRAMEGETQSLGVPIPVNFNGAPHDVLIQVRAVQREDLPRQALVFFLEGGKVSGAERAPDAKAAHDTDLVDQLRRELDLTRARLKTSREEFELTTEELRAANEELESINEEYRSTAEELETSKEELQSINEELQTVNSELKNQLETVARAHGDLQNLITATDVGTLFLDRELRIRRFTPRVLDLFNIVATDEGRLITDFTHQLDYDGLAAEARAVVERRIPVEREVRSRSGRWYLLRLRPYRTAAGQFDGVVVTLIDVSERRQAEDALRNSEERLLLATEAAGLGIYELDPATRELWLDRRARELLGLGADQPATMAAMYAVVRPDDVDEVRAAIDGALNSETAGAYSIEFRIGAEPGRQRWVRAQGKVFRPGTADAGRTRLLGTIQEITEHILATRQTLQLRELSHRIKNTLTIVQAIAFQTFHGPDAKEALERFGGRLHALATSHDILVESAWKGAELSTLVERQVAGLVDGAGRLDLEGPSVMLPETLATPLGLMLHELATNATKYGAFANERGRVRLTWRVIARDRPPILELDWEEHGGPPVAPPPTTGNGSLLIERGIPGAEVERDFRPEGLVCRVRLPLTNGRHTA